MNILWIKHYYTHFFLLLGVFTIFLWYATGSNETTASISIKSEARISSTQKDTNTRIGKIITDTNKASVQVGKVISLVDLLSESKLLGVFRMSAKGNRAFIQSPLSARAKMYYKNDVMSPGITVSKILNDRVEITDGVESSWLLLEANQSRKAAILQYEPLLDSPQGPSEIQAKTGQDLLTPLGLKFDPASGRFIPDDAFQASKQ